MERPGAMIFNVLPANVISCGGSAENLGNKLFCVRAFRAENTFADCATFSP